MRVLVCGGRAYADYETLSSTLTFLHRKTPFTLVIQGGAKGADYMAKYWAKLNGIKSVQFDADWDKYKKRAGSLRNTQMLEQGDPAMVVAFPGGPGTADMISKSIKANVQVMDIGNRVSIRPKVYPDFDFRSLMQNPDIKDIPDEL